ncbi:MAG: OFA family MFS transporter [Clostridiales bacterium]|nr:OFA family MFS transporter [Clostridiales bacterium]
MSSRKTKILSIGACLVTMFCIGIVYLWSVFQQPVIDHYGWSSSAVTMVSSAIIFFYVLGTLISGFIQDRTSPRLVVIVGGVLLCLGLFLTSLLGSGTPWLIYITYGVCAGFGVGFGYSGALNCIQKWYPHRRGFATGISVCAFGLATVILGPLIELFINKAGVPGAFRILAFTFPLVVIVMGLFIKNPTQEYLNSLKMPAARLKQRQYAPREAVRTLEFWCLGLSLLFLPAAYMMIIPRVKTLGLLRGLSENMTTITVSLTGVASAVSRLAAGYVTDKIGGARTIWILTAITLIASVLMTFAEGGLYIAAVMLIVCGYSGPAGIFPTLSTNAFGTKHSGTNYGLAFMFLGVASPLFTMISNVVSAGGVETGNYTAAFVIAAAGCVVPLVMLPIFDYARKKNRPRDDAMVEKDPSMAQ